MSCPHYVDFTRTCITRFPRVLEYSSYLVCESDEYQNCLAFIALKSGFLCKYHQACLEDVAANMPTFVKLFVEDEKTMRLFKSMVEKYCGSETQHRECACFKLFEQGIKPPTELLPDGRKMRLRDLIFKKEFVVE